MSTISCTEFSRQLSEAVERRDSVETPALREHASLCAECRSQWLDALLVDRALLQWKKPVAPAGLTERILAQVAAETAPVGAGTPLGPRLVLAQPASGSGPPRLARRISRTGAGVLAVVALGLCAALFVGRPHFRAPNSPVPANQLQVVEQVRPAGDATSARLIEPRQAHLVNPTRTPAVEAPVELMVADAGSAYLHLAGNAARAVTAATVLVPPADSVREPAAAPPRQERLVEGMRREIAPVTRQLSHAFQFLIQAVPEKRAPAT
jgi:hypothetical protein